MRPKMILWDWNGCLLDDCEWVYAHGPVRIFSHFKLPVPPLETYRNEVESDFMKTFYWKYGIPADVTAKDLDDIMKQGYAESGEPPLQPDSAVTLEACRQLGIRQAMVTGFRADMLEKSLAHHGLTRYFEQVHAGARDKVPLFGQILAAAKLDASEAIGVTDTLSDVAMLQKAGITPYICPRGFHGKLRIDAARAAHPSMRVVHDFAALLQDLQ